MSFRRIILGLITIVLTLMATAFGLLFVVCVTLYVLWHGLSVSVFAFGMLCVVFIAIACIFLRSASAKDKMLPVEADQALLADEAGLFSESVVREDRGRHTMV